MRTVLAEGVAELVADGQDQLLIIFAHRDATAFAFEGVTKTLPCARLLIRDPSLRGWYNAGLPGMGATVTDIADFIRARVDLSAFRRTATLGSSMGGYAAVLFGALLGVDQVLAFNPQTTLDRLFPLSPPHDVTPQVPDLGPAVAAACGTRFDLVIGDDDAADLCHAAHLVGQPGVSVWTVPGSSHLVTEELNQRGELAPLLKQWFEGRRMEILAGVATAASRDKSARLVHAVLAYLAADYRTALPLLAEAARVQADHAGLSLFVGMAAAAEGDTEAAVEALRTALRHRPSWDHAQHQLRLCLADRPDMTQASAPDRVHATSQEFEGTGQSIDAAVLDAVASAANRSQKPENIRAEVVGWGIEFAGITGARSFWARIRVRPNEA